MHEVVAAGERQIREAPGQWLSWFGLRGMWESVAKGRKGSGGGRVKGRPAGMTVPRKHRYTVPGLPGAARRRGRG